MKTNLALFGAAALLTLSAATQPAGATPPQRPTPTPAASRALNPDEQLFTTLIGRVSTAIEKQDMAAFGKFLAPEYVHYNPGNGSGNRAEELAYVGSWTKTTIQPKGPVKVNRYGNTAITVSTSTFSGVADGKDFNTALQMMIAWVLRDGQWQMAVVQSKLMPA
ncbi:hypothetical protein A0257_08345 [Hymenobacter psoromatis]|nr:hypothetical protein A0257_08345 [Hymenobacter psoromatis]